VLFLFLNTPYFDGRLFAFLRPNENIFGKQKYFVATLVRRVALGSIFSATFIFFKF
jgi:hypothetical protein